MNIFVNSKEISSCMKLMINGVYSVSIILFISGLYIFYSIFGTLQNAITGIASTDKTFLYICIVIATLLILISMIGCSNKYEHPYFSKIYGGLILICLILQIIVFLKISKINPEEMTTKIKEKYIYKYDDASQKIKELIDVVQIDNKCCGIESYKDYNKFLIDLPKSCCNLADETYCSSINVYKKGCRSSIREKLLANRSIFFVVIGLSFCIQLLIILFSILLSKDLSIQSNV